MSNEHQDFERSWWGQCLTTFGEETKQLVYTSKVGVSYCHVDGQWPVFDLQGKSVVDLGGGPVSPLLKARNFKLALVVDPCGYPEWARQRYAHANIQLRQEPVESCQDLNGFDECWIFNVLQHVESPSKFMEVAKKAAKTIRIFEWIDLPAHLGHPHTLTQANLESWIGCRGNVEQLNDRGCVGRAWFGTFQS